MDVYEKYQEMREQLVVEVERMRAELHAKEGQLALIDDMLSDLSRMGGGSAVPARPVSAAKPVQSATPVQSTPPAQRRPAPVAARTTRGKGKGRRRAAGTPTRPALTASPTATPSSDDINELSIVDAAIALARKHNSQRANASDVHTWFTNAGFERRNGTPTRNSIYVSLNREATQSEGDPSARVRKVGRGEFEFRF